jgi:putative ABC transport system substrate-binding protein
VRRRAFITLLGSAVTWSLGARAQPPERVRRIGVISGANDQLTQARIAAFIQGLQQLGWTEGRNAHIDARWSAGNAAEIRRYAAELVALAPDVIFTAGSSSMGPLLEATHTVPIVFAIVPDPIGSGFVKSLSRSGSNATGFMMFEYSLCGKWPALLKEIAPHTTRAAVLRDPTVPAGIGQFAVIQSVAGSVGLDVIPVNLTDAAEFKRELADFAQSANGGLNPAQAARGLSGAQLCRCRGINLLRAEFPRPVPSSREIRRSYPQGRETGRPSGAGADQVRAGDQPQNCEGIGTHSAALASCPCR